MVAVLTAMSLRKTVTGCCFFSTLLANVSAISVRCRSGAEVTLMNSGSPAAQEVPASASPAGEYQCLHEFHGFLRNESMSEDAQITPSAYPLQRNQKS
ncbi:MAG: hypothetical protein IPH26_05795 [Sterolibacteriaceae bacterium]|uniref:Uncharacterized protein n=1 Tax=Candidatus Methylophosphatis roskildensis TaxID=2899263 RepID=A0A9D7E266_9PROT|nr:hypothetical protein [Candidatus Methylophosphatis roskildensis]